jgi:hypothetical protein
MKEKRQKNHNGIAFLFGPGSLTSFFWKKITNRCCTLLCFTSQSVGILHNNGWRHVAAFYRIYHAVEILVRNKRVCPASLTPRSTRTSMNEQNKGFILLGPPHNHAVINVYYNTPNANNGRHWLSEIKTNLGKISTTFRKSKQKYVFL